VVRRAARFSTQPHPAPAPTHWVIDALTTRPDTLAGAKQCSIHHGDRVHLSPRSMLASNGILAMFA